MTHFSEKYQTDRQADRQADNSIFLWPSIQQGSKKMLHQTLYEDINAEFYQLNVNHILHQ